MLGLMLVGSSLAVGVFQAQATPDVPAVAATRYLVLVIPRDEWRLTVATDGSAWINYAALPQTARAPSRTVSFSAVHSELRSRVATGPCIRDSIARVEFVPAARADAVPLCMADESFAVALFERVWSRVDPERDSAGAEQVTLLRRMWATRREPR
jgi:hypothetical protein